MMVSKTSGWGFESFPSCKKYTIEKVNLGFGQLIIIMLLGLLLFGDLPKILKNLTTSLQTLKKGLKDNQDENK